MRRNLASFSGDQVDAVAYLVNVAVRPGYISNADTAFPYGAGIRDRDEHCMSASGDVATRD
jgi:hypothetical protein